MDLNATIIDITPVGKIYDLVKTKKKGAAQCAMVERPGLGPELCDYQSQVLTNYTTSPYNGAFHLPTQAPSAGKLYLLTYADLRHTNCLIFAHIRPVRRHGLSIE